MQVCTHLSRFALVSRIFPGRNAKKYTGYCIIACVPMWQREKDSNPHIQSQSLLCYPYTIPLFRMRKRYYTCFQIKVKIIFVFLPLGAGVCYNDSVKGRDPHE